MPRGRLADWYAVVALFKRPLGLPIPHTAIIQGNQHRIADKLGEFIELHFLEAAPVDAKLRQIDFAGFTAEWPRHGKGHANPPGYPPGFFRGGVPAPEAMAGMSFFTRRITSQLQ